MSLIEAFIGFFNRIDCKACHHARNHQKGHGLDSDRARAAGAQAKEWREQLELWLPRFPREKIIEIDSTLEYPAGGSATGAGRR